jgi:hypothetical protein
MNERWHAENKLHPNAPLSARAQWHLEHRRECGCRPIPEKLFAQMRELGMVEEAQG